MRAVCLFSRQWNIYKILHKHRFLIIEVVDIWHVQKQNLLLLAVSGCELLFWVFHEFHRHVRELLTSLPQCQIFTLYFLVFLKKDSNLKHLQRKMSSNSLFAHCYTSLFLHRKWPLQALSVPTSSHHLVHLKRGVWGMFGRLQWCDGRESNSAVLQELGEICGWETKSEK